jgi:hypothetical protein
MTILIFAGVQSCVSQQKQQALVHANQLLDAPQTAGAVSFGSYPVSLIRCISALVQLKLLRVACRAISERAMCRHRQADYHHSPCNNSRESAKFAKFFYTTLTPLVRVSSPELKAALAVLGATLRDAIMLEVGYWRKPMIVWFRCTCSGAS